MEDALLWQKEGKDIRCNLCSWLCLIPEGKTGYCGVRINKKNALFTKNYGKISHMSIEPVEKMPFFHFFPGQKVLSMGSFGCNFKCQFCIDSEITENFKIKGKTYNPEEIINMVNDKNIRMIVFTYNEPTIFFEFAYRVARLAKRYNIKIGFITNGYITSEAIKKIGKYLDAATVDFKASGDPEFYKKYIEVPDVSPLFDTLKNFKKHGVFLEISNLIVPGVGDKQEMNRKLAEWIVSNLNSSIPYHLIRYSPAHKMKEFQPTPEETLDRFAGEAELVGLRHVYIHNVWGSKYENTYCYNCKQPIIERTGFFVNKINMIDDRCPNCGVKINVVLPSP